MLRDRVIYTSLIKYNDNKSAIFLFNLIIIIIKDMDEVKLFSYIASTSLTRQKFEHLLVEQQEFHRKQSMSKIQI